MHSNGSPPVETAARPPRSGAPSVLQLWLPHGIGQAPLDVLGGVLQGCICIFFAVAFAVYIFPHTTAGLAVGLGTLLIGLVAINVVFAFAAQVQPVVAGPQDTTAVVLAVMATAVSASLNSHAPNKVLPTILLLAVVSTMTLGVTFLLLGIFRVGQVVRYLPYPVLGGFLAGTGWLLIVGGFGMLTGQPVTGPGSLSPLVIGQIVLGFALAAAIPLLQRLVPHYLTFLVTLLGAIVLFYVAVWLFGVPMVQVRASGWLVNPLPPGSLAQTPWLASLPQVDWSLVLDQSGNIFTLVVVNAVAALLNIAGMEVALHQSADVDRELRVHGVANVLAGLFGGVGGYDYVSLSVLAQRGGARSRIVPLVTGLMALGALLGGSALLSLVPRFLIGGLTLYVGVELLYPWLVGMWSAMPRLEYAIVVLITLVIAIAGFFPGVLVGTLAAVVLFAVTYSRTSVVKHELSGAAYRSNVDRPLDHQRALGERGDAIQIYALEGFIFFGTANRILERIRARVSDSGSAALRYAILDFRHVTGLDSSATYSFSQVDVLLREYGAELIYTDLMPTMRERLRTPVAGMNESVRHFPDLDRALEWCENALLADLPDARERPLATSLASEMGAPYSPRDIEERLLAHLPWRDVPQGGYVIRQGDDSSEMYLLSEGQVAVMLDLPSGHQVRLRVLNPGALVGELAYYRQTPRTASVIAIEPSICYRVTREALRSLEERDADIVAAFHAYVARVLSERLTTMDGTLAALLR